MQSLERQHYTKRDVVRAVGERLVHYTLRTPEESMCDEIVLTVPGIMAKRRLYNPYARDLASSGIAAATMAHEGASPLCTQEVLSVVRDIAQSTQRPVRLAGHSLGGMHATMAALHEPEGISGLLLMQPAGYGGVHPMYAISSLRERPGNHLIASELRAVLDGIDYLVSSRPDQLLRAAIVASQYRVAHEARNLDEHIKRDALLFPHDRLIRADEVRLGLAHAGFSLYTLDTSNSPIRAGHNAVMYRAQDVAKATAAIIQTDTDTLVA